MLKRLHLLLALFILTVNAAMAQITTSGISGKISSNGETVIGATVTATHQPSGTCNRDIVPVLRCTMQQYYAEAGQNPQQIYMNFSTTFFTLHFLPLISYFPASSNTNFSLEKVTSY